MRLEVLDFGIAKLTGTLRGNSPPTAGTMGTPAYAAIDPDADRVVRRLTQARSVYVVAPSLSKPVMPLASVVAGRGPSPTRA